MTEAMFRTKLRMSSVYKAGDHDQHSLFFGGECDNAWRAANKSGNSIAWWWAAPMRLPNHYQWL